jgi:hypothetical protein
MFVYIYSYVMSQNLGVVHVGAMREKHRDCDFTQMRMSFTDEMCLNFISI